MNILLCESSDIMREGIANYLKNIGHLVVSTKSINEFNIAKHHDYDVSIIDIDMLNYYAIEYVNEMIYRENHCFVIATTINKNRIRYPFDSILSKYFDSKTVLNEINKKDKLWKKDILVQK